MTKNREDERKELLEQMNKFKYENESLQKENTYLRIENELLKQRISSLKSLLTVSKLRSETTYGPSDPKRPSKNSQFDVDHLIKKVENLKPEQRQTTLTILKMKEMIVILGKQLDFMRQEFQYFKIEMKEQFNNAKISYENHVGEVEGRKSTRSTLGSRSTIDADDRRNTFEKLVSIFDGYKYN